MTPDAPLSEAELRKAIETDLMAEWAKGSCISNFEYTTYGVTAVIDKVVHYHRALAGRVKQLEHELSESLSKVEDLERELGHEREYVQEAHYRHEQLNEQVTLLQHELADAQARVKELEQQRIKYGPICLNCGADKPCMTEEEANKHGASIPCTFDPAPRELWDRCKRLEQQNAALRERVTRIEKAARELEPMLGHADYDLWDSAVDDLRKALATGAQEG